MIHCWPFGGRVLRVTHRAIHQTIHRVRHHYHSPAVKIFAPAIVCVSMGAGLAPWLTSTTPLPGAQGPPAALFPGNAVPVGGGMFVGVQAGVPAIEIPITPELFELPTELVNLNSIYESSITAPSPAPSESPQSVPEPSSMLLLCTAIILLALARSAARGLNVRIFAHFSRQLAGWSGGQHNQPRGLTGGVAPVGSRSAGWRRNRHAAW